MNSDTGSIGRRGFLALAGSTGAGLALAGCRTDDSGSGIDDRIDELPPEVNATGFPIVNEPVTLRFMTGRPAATAEDWNQVASWKHYQEQSGITVDWGPVLADGIGEKVNLALASGDYPEALWNSHVSALDIGRYGEQGTFVGWQSLIESYMPNLQSAMEQYPEIANGMTHPDGEVYSMPAIQHPDFDALKYKYKLWINGEWADKLGLAIPATVDDYVDYLRAVQSERPGGDEVVAYGDVYGADGLFFSLSGSYGISNRGVTQPHLDVDPDTQELRFYKTTDRYRELIALMASLYKEKLIAADIFSVDGAKFGADARELRYASMVTTSPEASYGKVGQDFRALPALSGPHGDKSWNYLYSRLTGIGRFVMTDKAEHPVALARWLDHLYGEEGTETFFMGVEGESFRRTDDGGVEYLPEITEAEGKTLDEALKPYVTYMGGGYPGLVREGYFLGNETFPQAVEGADLVAPDAIDEVWAQFTFTTDEASTVAALASDIEKYVTESRDRFIAGDLDIDADWDGYLKNLQQMGLDDYLEIQTAAHDRGK